MIVTPDDLEAGGRQALRIQIAFAALLAYRRVTADDLAREGIIVSDFTEPFARHVVEIRRPIDLQDVTRLGCACRGMLTRSLGNPRRTDGASMVADVTDVLDGHLYRCHREREEWTLGELAEGWRLATAYQRWGKRTLRCSESGLYLPAPDEGGGEVSPWDDPPATRRSPTSPPQPPRGRFKR